MVVAVLAVVVGASKLALQRAGETEILDAERFVDMAIIDVCPCVHLLALARGCVEIILCFITPPLPGSGRRAASKLRRATARAGPGMC